MRAVVLVLGVCACDGVFGLTGSKSGVDSAVDPDSASDAPTCMASERKWHAEAHPELTDQLVDPTLVESGLELFASRNGILVHATRASVSVPFDPPTDLDLLGWAGSFMSRDPALTADGNTLVFASRTTNGVVQSSRTGAGWTTPTAVLGVYPEQGLDLSPDGTILYLSENGTLGRYRRDNTAMAFSTGADLGIDVSFPSVTDDGRRVYFTDGVSSTIQTATRGNELQSFSPGEPFVTDGTTLSGVELDASFDGKRLVLRAKDQTSATMITTVTRVCD